MHDLNQALQYISALTGSDTSVVTFQAFYDPKDGTQRPDLAKVWHSTLQDSLEYIEWAQSQQCGIYVCINGTDLQGREIYNINDFRVFFVDFDGMTEPQWAVEPHFITKRDDTHGHAYWLIDAGDIDHNDWTVIQKQLSMFYGSDSQVIDPCRVARLPGSLHLKNPATPVSYSVVSDLSKSKPRYSVEDIRVGHLLPADKDAELHRWIDARKGIDEGIGYEDNDFERNNFISFITNAAHPAVLGSGTHELYRVACYGHDHGIPLKLATELLWEHYNPRCLPPWEAHEKNHFVGVVYRAYHYPKSAPGCKTAKAGFQAIPRQEPSCGWEGQAELFNKPVTPTASEVIVTGRPTVTTDNTDLDALRGDYRISRADASIRVAQLTPKSSHYDFAVVFVGANYDGVNLIRNKKQFYTFTGKSWKTVDDEVIKAQIQRSFAVFKPADALTAGIFKVVCDHVNVDEVENGTWLTGENSDTSNLAIFQNGIVDLNAETPKLLPHTPAFFALNELDYDFEPGARCPQWFSFLDSIWGDDQLLKDQLQEWMGYCLTTDVSLQRFALFTGKSGGGKGTTTTVLSNVVGHDNVAAPALGKIHKDTSLNEMARKSLTMIPDARDIHPSSRDDVLSTMLAVVGGDPVSFHELYKGSRNEVMKTKVLLSANGMPAFHDASGALVRRMMVFPFTKSFYGNGEDPHLGEKLKTETAGICQWAIEGLRRLRSNNGQFTEANAGLVEKNEIKREMFPLSQFVESSCVLGGDDFTMLDDLYSAYRLWCNTEGVKTPMMKGNFNRCLRNSSLAIGYKPGDKQGFTGITVKANFAVNNVVGFQRRHP
jgi:P4 family phage/plasmid primase-like protien